MNKVLIHGHDSRAKCSGFASSRINPAAAHIMLGEHFTITRFTSIGELLVVGVLCSTPDFKTPGGASQKLKSFMYTKADQRVLNSAYWMELLNQFAQ